MMVFLYPVSREFVIWYFVVELVATMLLIIGMTVYLTRPSVRGYWAPRQSARQRRSELRRCNRQTRRTLREQHREQRREEQSQTPRFGL